jgi:S1-C subfamily serine protease
MRALVRSQFTAAVAGGLVVAASFVALGLTGEHTTQTVIQQATTTGADGEADHALTPHAIYVRNAPGVVFVKAVVSQEVSDPFNIAPVKEQANSTGSGFLITSSGYILTNFHVIDGADPYSGVTVNFENDIARRAQVVGEDEGHDLALLKVDMNGVPVVRPLALGDSTTVKVGDPTLAIANPFGYDRTLTSGIVSALQRQIQAPSGFAINNVIQTDAPITPGNSGGPLLDADGHVIGIDSQIATGGSVGIAFAVPIDTVKAFIRDHPPAGALTLHKRASASSAQNETRSPGPGAGATLHEGRRAASRSRPGASACGATLRCGGGPKRGKNQVLRDYRTR